MSSLPQFFLAKLFGTIKAKILQTRCPSKSVKALKAWRKKQVTNVLAIANDLGIDLESRIRFKISFTVRVRIRVYMHVCMLRSRCMHVFINITDWFLLRKVLKVELQNLFRFIYYYRLVSKPSACVAPPSVHHFPQEQTRYRDFSLLGAKVPTENFRSELSLPGTKVPGNFRSRDSQIAYFSDKYSLLMIITLIPRRKWSTYATEGCVLC